MNDVELRQRLTSAASSVRVGDPPIERSLSRGLSRLRFRRLTAGMTAVALVAASGWSLFALRDLDRDHPAVALTQLGEVSRIHVGGAPQLIAASEDAAWTVAGSVGQGTRGDTLYRVDRTSGEVRALQLGGFAMGVGAEGHRAWAIVCQTLRPHQAENGCSRAVLVEMGSEGGEVVSRIPIGEAFSPNQAVLAGGVVAAQAGDGVVTARDGSVIDRFPCCRGVMAGGFGSIWSIRDQAVDRLDPRTGSVVTIHEVEPCGRYGAIDVGEGAVWVAGCDGRVWRIDAATNTAGEPIDGGSGNMVAAGDGSVWLIGRTSGNDIEIRRIDPRTRVVGPPRTIQGSIGAPRRAIKCGVCRGDPLFPAIGGGVLWLSNFTSDEVIRIQLRSDGDPGLERPAVAHFLMGGRPIRPVAVGYGAAWINVHDESTRRMALARIDRVSGEVVRVSAAGEAGYVAVGGGMVWTASCAHPGNDPCNQTKIVRIDPVSLQATAETPIEDPVFGIAYGAGSLWVTVNDGREGHLLRVDPDTASVVSTIDGWACCSGTVFGEGVLWSLGSGGGYDGELTSLDPATLEVKALPKLRPRFRFGGHSLGVGEGAVWVTVGTPGRSPVARIDPATGKVTAVGDSAWFGWFAAAEGGVWFARPTERTPLCVEVLRIDPTAATSEVVRVLTLTGESQPTEGPGGPAIGVGAGDGDLWITIDATGEVIRVDVESLGDAIIADPGCSPAPQGSPL